MFVDYVILSFKNNVKTIKMTNMETKGYTYRTLFGGKWTKYKLMVTHNNRQSYPSLVIENGDIHFLAVLKVPPQYRAK